MVFIAAMEKRDQQVCHQIDIEVQGASQTLFIDRNDIINMLTANGGRKIKGQQIRSLHLKELEVALGKNVWLESADLFFDKNATLQVRVRENIPIGRIFSTTGNSWYIDSAGHRLPLSDKFSARLPVFTGFPTDKRNLSTQDSILLHRIKSIAGFLHANPFWMAQVTAINITPEKQFEIYPLVGSHIIELGDGQDLDKRFGRLDLFYKQVMQQTGPNAWSRLKIQYDKQVIAVRTKKNNNN